MDFVVDEFNMGIQTLLVTKFNSKALLTFCLFDVLIKLYIPF